MIVITKDCKSANTLFSLIPKFSKPFLFTNPSDDSVYLALTWEYFNNLSDPFYRVQILWIRNLKDGQKYYFGFQDTIVIKKDTQLKLYDGEVTIAND